MTELFGDRKYGCQTSWPDDKRNYHGTNAISSNPIISIYRIQIKIKLTNLLVIFLTYNHILLFKLFIKVK